MGVGYLTTFPQRGRRQARLNQPQLLVGVSQRGGGFDRVGAGHRQVEPLARQDFSDGDHLQAIVFAHQQRVLVLARRRDLVTHGFARQVHRDEEAELGLVALTIRIERGLCKEKLATCMILLAHMISKQ